MVALKHKANVLLVQFRAFLRFHRLHGIPVELELAAPGTVVHPQNMEQRRLAGAGRPHDGEKLSLFDIDVDLPQDERLADAVRVRFFQVA